MYVGKMIRYYTSSDQGRLLELLRLNIPKYFDLSEVEDYAIYLEQYVDSYYVVEDKGEIIGAGGLNYGFDNGRKVRISWDVIHPDFQGKGIGTLLTKHRLNQVNLHPEVMQVEVRTTQLVYKFYQKLGFKLLKIENDFWADGFDLYLMMLDLTGTTAKKSSKNF